jgi:hypothetical protein
MRRLAACVGLVGLTATAHAQLHWSAVPEVVAVSESQLQHTARFPWTLPAPSGDGVGAGETASGGGGSVTVTSITTGCGCTTARFVPPRKAPGSPTPGSSDPGSPAPGSAGASDGVDRTAGDPSGGAGGGGATGGGGGASGGLVVLEPGEGALEAVFTFGDRVGRHVKKIVIRSRSTDADGSPRDHVTTLTLDLTIQPTLTLRRKAAQRQRAVIGWPLTAPQTPGIGR